MIGMTKSKKRKTSRKSPSEKVDKAVMQHEENDKNTFMLVSIPNDLEDAKLTYNYSLDTTYAVWLCGLPVSEKCEPIIELQSTVVLPDVQKSIDEMLKLSKCDISVVSSLLSKDSLDQSGETKEDMNKASSKYVEVEIL